jgi:hypothetical protein
MGIKFGAGFGQPKGDGSCFYCIQQCASQPRRETRHLGF